MLIFFACVVENCFPPSPSDVFVALAAFLAHRGHLAPWSIFAAAWVGGVLGAVIVYAVARRYAGPFLESRVGRMLLPPKATAFMQKEYLRYGLIGIFVVRLLPGFRSVVAPFAGLGRLSPVQLLVPVALASALWYGTITVLGYRLGSRWEEVLDVLGHLNRGLAIVAAVVAVLGVSGIVWWRRRRGRE